jgi:hypothetical protein
MGMSGKASRGLRSSRIVKTMNSGSDSYVSLGDSTLLLATGATPSKSTPVKRFGGYAILTLLFRQTPRILATRWPVCGDSGVYAVGYLGRTAPTKLTQCWQRCRIARKKKMSDKMLADRALRSVGQQVLEPRIDLDHERPRIVTRSVSEAEICGISSLTLRVTK